MGAEPDKNLQRNFILGAVCAGFLSLGMTFSHDNMVLALFIKRLGASNAVVGTLSTLRFGCWFLPQLFVAGKIQQVARKMPFYTWFQGTRALAFLVLALAVLLAGERFGLVLGLFLFLYMVSRLAAGIASVPRADIFAKIIPPRLLASFFGQRNLWQRIAALVASVMVGFILSERSGLRFPRNYALLFLLAGVTFALATASFSRIVEPIHPVAPGRRSTLGELRGVPRILAQDRNYRRLVLVRLALSLHYMADAFYILYAKEVLGAPLSMVGIYFPLFTVSGILANFLWGYIGLRHGNRRVVMLVGLAALSVPVMALAVPLVSRGIGGLVPGVSYLGLNAGLFALVFLLQGLADSGEAVSELTYLLEVAPAGERPTYVGLMNSLLAFTSLLPIASGILSEVLGYRFIFLLTAVGLVVSFLVSLGLAEPPSRLRTAA